ncbi:hypothetical protein HYQ46_010919 [Verticillium longisporum]|nr:hypothetical protein HYQ46_010919 [Verticillium longisporum]
MSPPLNAIPFPNALTILYLVAMRRRTRNKGNAARGPAPSVTHNHRLCDPFVNVRRLPCVGTGFVERL